MRKMISTTLRVDLWEELGIAALRQKVDRNDILEELIADYLKKQKGGKR